MQNDQLTHFNPYQFALKEGLSIKKNPFDYSLVMIQTEHGEILRSPSFEPSQPEPFLIVKPHRPKTL